MELPKHDPGIPRTMQDDVSTYRHHYIPKFYLKGFTDKQEKFFRYDKFKGDYQYVGTKSIFWQEGLNTGVLKHPETGEIHYSDLPEHLFSGMESMLAKSIDILRNTDASIRIMDTPEAVDTIKQLIHFLFWRVPSNKEFLDKLIDGKAFSELGFRFTGPDGKILHELEGTMKGIDLWRKMYPALIASGRSRSSFRKNNNIHWDTYYMNWNHSLVTDNPIILKSFEGPESLEGNLLFPLSLNMLIVAIEGKKKPSLTAMIREQIDVLLFHQAKRYVVCPKKEYIIHIKDKLENFYSPQSDNWAELLKEQIFDNLTDKGSVK